MATEDPNNFYYGRKGPWPQPNPARPFGEAPAVLSTPWSMRLDWWLAIGFRIFAEIGVMTPIALIQSMFRRVRNFPTNDRFNEVMTTSCYQKFFCPTLDPPDLIAFAPYLGDPGATYYKSDFTAIAGVKPYAGMHIAPTVSLIKEKAGVRTVVAVNVKGVVIDPTHTNAWNLAKFFVMQGAAYSMLFTEHPNLHFPMDAINAIAITSVPKDHLISKLLKPHLIYELELDREVLFEPVSVITDWRPTIYAPFTADLKDGLLDFFSAGYIGVPGNSAYPSYEFRKRPKKVYGDYGVFLDRYYDTVLEFTKKVAAKIPTGDDYTTRWAHYCSQWIPQFPTAPAIFAGDTLAEVLAGIIWDMSVGHAVDHKAFTSDVTAEEKFLRIHLDPPVSTTMPAVDPKKVATWWDGVKLLIAHKAFFEPHTITRLVDTQYNFGDPVLDAANQDFLLKLRQTEASMPVKNYIPLDEISASIQY